MLRFALRVAARLVSPASGVARSPVIGHIIANTRRVVPRRRRGADCRVLSITCRRALSKMGLIVNAQSPTRQGVATPSSNSPRRRRGCCRHMQSPAACSGCCSAADEGSQYRLCWLTVWVTFSERMPHLLEIVLPNASSRVRLLTGLPFRVPPDLAACARLRSMADPVAPIVQDVLDHAWQSAQPLGHRRDRVSSRQAR
jgi:hypothetical protein